MTKRILIVDDEPNIVISLEFLMKKEGFEVAIANDGEDALAKVASFNDFGKPIFAISFPILILIIKKQTLLENTMRLRTIHQEMNMRSRLKRPQPYGCRIFFCLLYIQPCMY